MTRGLGTSLAAMLITLLIALTASTSAFAMDSYSGVPVSHAVKLEGPVPTEKDLPVIAEVANAIYALRKNPALSPLVDPRTLRKQPVDQYLDMRRGAEDVLVARLPDLCTPTGLIVSKDGGFQVHTSQVFAGKILEALNKIMRGSLPAGPTEQSGAAWSRALLFIDGFPVGLLKGHISHEEKQVRSLSASLYIPHDLRISDQTTGGYWLHANPSHWAGNRVPASQATEDRHALHASRHPPPGGGGDTPDWSG